MGHDLSMNLDGRGAWPDLLRADVQMASWQGLVVLPPPHAGDEPIVACRARLASGAPVFLTTTWPQLYADFMALAQVLGPPLLEEEPPEDASAQRRAVQAARRKARVLALRT